MTFWRLYWRQLNIVEDRGVESAMVELGRLVPAEAGRPVELPMTALGAPSYRLAHAAHGLVLASWKVDLPALQRSPTAMNNAAEASIPLSGVPAHPRCGSDPRDSGILAAGYILR